MAFFHHNTIRKYTLALLSTFNSLEVEKTKADGVSKTYSTVPLRFSTREKSIIFSEVETSQITNGNFNVIPRASLVFNSMTRAAERNTSKFNKINKKIKIDNESEIINFQYNAVPYDFSFSLIVMADGMNEASMIVEQIAARFNPIYNLYINEIPLQSEPTVIPLSLESINLETQEYEEYSTNIVTIECEFLLKGNIYPPITEASLVNKILIYNGLQEDNEFERVSRITWEKQLDETFLGNVESFSGRIRKVAPILESITGPEIVHCETNNDYVAIFDDPDNKYSELQFVWNIIPLNNESIDSIGILNINKAHCTLITKNLNTTVKLQLIIHDIHGNISTPFYKDIIIQA